MNSVPFVSARHLRRVGWGLLAVVFSLVRLSPADDGLDFGSEQKSSDALIGIFYDLKQNQKREPVDADYLKTLGEFVDSNWDETVLSRFFRVTRPVYATDVFIPNIGAGAGPVAFHVQNVVQPSHWFVVYKGQVSPPEDGTYRFVGIADDILAVGVNDHTELVSLYGGWFNYSRWKENPAENIPCEEGTLRHGDWFECRKDQIIDLDIVIGEFPGTACGAWLFIEKKGVTYPMSSDPKFKNIPVYPVFQLKHRNIAPANQPLPFTTSTPPWICHQ